MDYLYVRPKQLSQCSYYGTDLTIWFSNPGSNKCHIYSPTRADPTGIQPAPTKWLGERLVLLFYLFKS